MSKSKIELNGNFIVCKKKQKPDLLNESGFLVFNKETVPFYEIVEKHIDDTVDFPFEVGDTVCSASTGTVVNVGGDKTWLFQPEHILAKILSK